MSVSVARQVHQADIGGATEHDVDQRRRHFAADKDHVGGVDVHRRGDCGSLRIVSRSRVANVEWHRETAPDALQPASRVHRTGAREANRFDGIH
eukprot:663156-Prymnesium_polylepis.1